jgi:hypothetical protein
MIDFEAELDRLAADLAILDVACGAGTRWSIRDGHYDSPLLEVVGRVDQRHALPPVHPVVT